MAGINVTKSSHPALFAALAITSHDNGGGAGRSSYDIPPEWRGRVAAADTALAGLSEADLKVFCIGEEREAADIAGRHPELAWAKRLLDGFVEGWPRDEG